MTCDCGARSTGKWADIHSPSCSTFGTTVAERHAALRAMEYRAIDAQAGAVDYTAIHRFRNWLEYYIPHRVPVLDSLSDTDQTTQARGWEDDMDRAAYRQEQALGGPVHDREMYSDAASNRNLE